MVKQFGMSERVGLRTIPEADPEAVGYNVSDSTVELIDAEIKRLLQVGRSLGRWMGVWERGREG